MSNKPENFKPEINKDPEPAKPTKLQRIKAAAITTGIITIPTVIVAASLYAGMKVSINQLETAKINLEAAKLNKLADEITS